MQEADYLDFCEMEGRGKHDKIQGGVDVLYVICQR